MPWSACIGIRACGHVIALLRRTIGCRLLKRLSIRAMPAYTGSQTINCSSVFLLLLTAIAEVRSPSALHHTPIMFGLESACLLVCPSLHSCLDNCYFPLPDCVQFTQTNLFYSLFCVCFNYLMRLRSICKRCIISTDGLLSLIVCVRWARSFSSNERIKVSPTGLSAVVNPRVPF